MYEIDFLRSIEKSFKTFLVTGSRSNEKLKILHGAISRDLINLLGSSYKVRSLNIGDGREGSILGRYINKNVDIVVENRGRVVAGIGVKFVMQNYSQNSNNYFENMLGETANIRSNNIPYFQIFIVPETMPYYKSNGNWEKWEEFTAHNSKKYLILSQDNIDNFLHCPTKTLLYVIRLPEIKKAISNRQDYIEYYNNLVDFKVIQSQKDFGDFSFSVIYNDYTSYMSKISNYIKSI